MEQVSTSGVDMLDLHVFKGPGWSVSGFLDYRPLIKTTSLGIPLSCDSAHHHAIHSSWTHAEIKRLRCRSSSLDDFNRAKSNFIDRLRRYGFHAHILDRLRDYTPQPGRVPRERTSGDANVDGLRVMTFWCGFPFHPVWASSRLQRSIRAFLQRRRSVLQCLTAFNSLIDIRLAWKLDGMPFAQCLSNVCGIK